MQRFIAVLVTLLVALLAPRAYAQSNVLTQEQQAVFAQMDTSLQGYWEGHGDGDGMKFDPQAIACMVNKCSQIRQQYAQDPKQLRDSANFGSCYDAHMARIRRPGYVRLTNPPPIYVLGCNLIAAQAKSADDRVYAAVNGHQRNQPAPVIVRVARRGIVPTDAERAFLYAQMGKAPAASSSGRLVDDNPYKDSPPAAKPRAQQSKPNPVRKPVSVAANDNPYLDTPAPVASRPSKARASGGSSVVKLYGDLGDKLVLLTADETQATIYVKPGGQFYTVRASYLAEKYDTEWKSAYLANEFGDTFGACWNGNKVTLDPERMQAKSYDKAKLRGPVGTKFLEDCEGEFNFALQAGQVITLTAKSVAAPVQEPVQSPPPTKQAKGDPPPAPTASADPSTYESPEFAPALSAPVSDPPPTTAQPEVAPSPVESAVAPAESAAVPPSTPPPSNSGVINVTINGKKQPASSSAELGKWIEGRPGTVLLMFLGMGLLLLVTVAIRKTFNHIDQSPPPPLPPATSSGCGAGSSEPTLVTPGNTPSAKG
jgi:hypothetical protein